MVADTDTRVLWEGGEQVDWQLEPGKGRHGYAEVLRWQSAELWRGHKNSGPHVDLSGKACRDVADAASVSRETWGWREHMAWLDAMGAKVSRLDLAVDVVGVGLDMAELVAAIEDGRCISKWKESSWREMKGIGPNVRPGHTLYMGSPKSSSMLRIYDKKAEQRQPDSAPPWVRVEFQLRHEVAVAMGKKIATGGMRAAIRAARGYVDFLGSDGRSLPAWDAAMQSAAAEPLKVQRRGGSLDSMKGWFAEQVTPSLAVLLEASGGDVEVLAQMAAEGRSRWNAKHRSMAAEVRKGRTL
jgi:phage replication initiation protein